MIARIQRTLKKKRADPPGGKGDGEKKQIGPGDLLPPTANTFAGPTECICKCNEQTIVFTSAFANERDFAITIVNLGDCPIGAQIFTGVENNKLKMGAGSALAAKNRSTSLAGSIPSSGGFVVICQGDGSGSCRFYWRIDKV